MKSGIHPQYHPVVFVDSSNNEELVTMSTATSEVTREIECHARLLRGVYVRL